MLSPTELSSQYNNLESQKISDLLHAMNTEFGQLEHLIQLASASIENLISKLYSLMLNEGRLFYIGAGTSGRLGILDASECPPTFGVDKSKVIGIIAGGDIAIRSAIEHAEDDLDQGWEDLCKYSITSNDMVIGISASGNTPYVLGALLKCKQANIATGCITSNPQGIINMECDYPICIETGAELITGSTRLKAGSAAKQVLNMISTCVMIKLGHIKGNQMIDIQLKNNKLIDRGTRMICEATQLNYEEAMQLLLKYGSVRLVLENINKTT